MMKRFTSDDRNEQGHELMLAERNGYGAMLEPAVEGVASERTWSRRELVRLAGAALAGVAGLAAFGSDNAQGAHIVAAGRSRADRWVQYHSGLYIDVNLTAYGFSSTPVYVTSLGGYSYHWELLGGGAVYNATKDGFRVYVKHYEDKLITPEYAKEKNWHVEWHAIHPTPLID